MLIAETNGHYHIAYAVRFPRYVPIFEVLADVTAWCHLSYHVKNIQGFNTAVTDVSTAAQQNSECATKHGQPCGRRPHSKQSVRCTMTWYSRKMTTLYTVEASRRRNRVPRRSHARVRGESRESKVIVSKHVKRITLYNSQKSKRYWPPRFASPSGAGPPSPLRLSLSLCQAASAAVPERLDHAKKRGL